MILRNTPIVLLAVFFAAVCIVESGIKPIHSVSAAKPEESAIYALAGEFRTVAANLLWIKADSYHHEFLARNDDWSANKELIGLFKLIVGLDPHFEEAYASGMYIYAKGYKDPEKALSFLEEGLRYNPHSWDLNRLAALLYAIEFNDYSTALSYAKTSYECCENDFDRNLVKRLIVTLQDKIAHLNNPEEVTSQAG